MTGPGNSPFSVTLDNGPSMNYTATKQSNQPQVLLYTAMDLSPGSHVVKVAYEPSIANQIFAIDYANVYTTPSLKARSASTSSSRGLPMGAVAGIIIAVLFILFILTALSLFIRRRRLIKRRKARPSFESPMVQSARGDCRVSCACTHAMVSCRQLSLKWVGLFERKSCCQHAIRAHCALRVLG
ncbi:hypothetical protein FB45DRAFT_196999 [Roridomyces roridus]|uniref:Uncharacterized protein n=1 Tax=Roridomyces roridus TaxID=1738132 RepID=A0AAD7G0I2_9AGAR|nr:hypothetical protein FB45DRAFT_196999 [Roridomyces roridus]